MAAKLPRALVFFSYARRDKMLRDRLEDHLSNLKYRGIIVTWYDREISAGDEWARQIDDYLEKAHIILFLISSDFMASEYCYSIEMKRALERHEQGEADVIPILLRPVLYTDAPFAKLQLLPTNGKPVIQWRYRDSAFVDIAYGIEKVAQKYSLLLRRTSDIYSHDRAAPLSTGARGADGNSLFPLFIGGLVVIGLILASILVLVQHPTLIPLIIIHLFDFILGFLLLVTGVAATRKVIGAIHARSEQKRVQEAHEPQEEEVQQEAHEPQEEEEVQQEARRREYYGKTLQAYQRALRDPSDWNALRGLANTLYALERYDEALNAFRKAIEVDPTPATYAGLGNVFAKLQQHSEAIAAYEKAIGLDPTVTLNYDDFIQSLQILGREEQAEQVRARAKQLGYEDEG